VPAVIERMREAVPLIFAALLAPALALTGCGDGDGGAGETGPVAATFAAQEGKPFGEPPRLLSRDGALPATLTVAEGEIDVAGAKVRGKSYNGTFPGPTMVVEPGDWIRLRLVNRLDQQTNIHFHGFHTSPAGIADNVLRSIPAHSVARVAVPVPAAMEPGTYWYHSHAHGVSEEQVFDGLSGAIVVKGLEERLPRALRDVEQRLFTLKDLQVSDGAIVAKDINSDAPTTRTVNGLVDPRVEIRPGQTQLWRLANISADIWYRLHFTGGPFHVIAEDSNPVGEVWPAGELLLPPGKRFDVLVRGPDRGRYQLKTLRYSTGPAGDTYPQRTLATVVSAGEREQPLPLPRSLGPLPGYERGPVDRVRRFTFSESDNGNRFFINGKEFNHHVVNVHTRLGSFEQWVIRNVSDEQHPFHIHVDDFQVLSVNGKPHDARSLQDTQPLPVHGKVVIRLRFTDFTGKFVYHCHILAHEDNGMMGIIKVSP
jgi:suppressor of ftsI